MVSSIDVWKKKSRVETILRASGAPWNYQLHPLGSPSPTSTLDPQDDGMAQHHETINHQSLRRLI